MSFRVAGRYLKRSHNCDSHPTRCGIFADLIVGSGQAHPVLDARAVTMTNLPGAALASLSEEAWLVLIA